MDTAGCEIGNLELDLDRSLAFAGGHAAHATAETTHHSTAFVIITADGREAKLSTHEKFFATTELLDLPHDGRGFRGVVDGAYVGSESGAVCIIWNRDYDGDVVGGAAAFELCFGLSRALVSSY